MQSTRQQCRELIQRNEVNANNSAIKYTSNQCKHKWNATVKQTTTRRQHDQKFRADITVTCTDVFKSSNMNTWEWTRHKSSCRLQVTNSNANRNKIWQCNMVKQHWYSISQDSYNTSTGETILDTVATLEAHELMKTAWIKLSGKCINISEWNIWVETWMKRTRHNSESADQMQFETKPSMIQVDSEGSNTPPSKCTA